MNSNKIRWKYWSGSCRVCLACSAGTALGLLRYAWTMYMWSANQIWHKSVYHHLQRILWRSISEFDWIELAIADFILSRESSCLQWPVVGISRWFWCHSSWVVRLLSTEGNWWTLTEEEVVSLVEGMHSQLFWFYHWWCGATRGNEGLLPEEHVMK